MDVYEVLFQKCLEYEVIVDGKEVPLWKLKKEDIDNGNVDFDLQWDSLQDLAISLYELKKEQQKSKELIKYPLEEILVGIAFLKSKKSGYLITDDMNNINTCLNYLSELITARINCISRYYYLIKKPMNTNLFDEIILKFPQKKDIKVKNIEDLKELVFKLKNLEFKNP
jgi:hypothetical protein